MGCLICILVHCLKMYLFWFAGPKRLAHNADWTLLPKLFRQVRPFPVEGVCVYFFIIVTML